MIVKIKKFVRTMFVTNLRRMMWSLIFMAISASMIYNGGALGELIRNPKNTELIDKWVIITYFFLACFIGSFMYYVIDGIIKIKRRKKND